VKMELTVYELGQRLGAEVVMPSEGRGMGGLEIRSVGPVGSAGAGEITFIVDERYEREVGKLRAGAVIVGRRIEGLGIPQLVVKDVKRALIEVLEIFAPKVRGVAEGIDSTAKVGRGVKIGEGAYSAEAATKAGVSIGAFVVLEERSEIGAGSVLQSGCRVGENSKVGKRCRIGSNVVIEHNCVIGDDCVIQANSTIGSTGFGYYFIDGAHRLIPHNGGVVIEDFVEIGANCCVDRAKFGNTVIGRGTKIDNLVQIAHNVVIGKNCLIAGQAGMGGSCKVGDGVIFAGQSGAVDNIEIGEGTIIGAKSVVTHSVSAGQEIFGVPAADRAETLKVIALTRRLPKLVEQIKELGSRIERLEASKDDKR